MKRLIVTGWRGATSEHRPLIEAALTVHRHEDITLVHGDGQGVDQLAAAIVTDWGWLVEPHPAAWDRCGSGCPRQPHLRFRGVEQYCPYAGPRRNTRMCAAGADLVMAFPGPRSRGTYDCLRRAAQYGIPAEVHPLAVGRG